MHFIAGATYPLTALWLRLIPLKVHVLLSQARVITASGYGHYHGPLKYMDYRYITSRDLLLFRAPLSVLFTMVSSLWRIPCIIVSTMAFHKATTAPHPAPAAKENAPSTGLEIILKQRSGGFIVKVRTSTASSSDWMNFFFQNICWFAVVAETTVILACQVPGQSHTQKVLSTCAGDPQNIRPTDLFFVGGFMTCLGGYIRWSCYRALGRLFTFEMSIRDDHRLVADGPYSVVRHPAYTGILLAITGIVLLHASPGSWARECGILQTNLGRISALIYLAVVTTITTGLILRMPKEDAALKKAFGKTWEAWARRVPDKLVPWVY